ncbi:MAG: pyridoxal phosphate-dependent aminotransferase [Candidatus Vogelbacteria bacterium]|nr:pyridoxal phosphate-dependent aminotransferase [Candidatus Vogelbacteria bacterium]
MLRPRIQTGANLFQLIKAICREAEEEGKQLFRLSIGQPTGPAFLSARVKAAELIMSDEEKWHEYQDNGCVIPNFAQRFVQAHVPTTRFDQFGERLAYLPIPGIKSMLEIVIMACLHGLPPMEKPLRVYTTTKPGYPTPADQCRYLEDNGAQVRHQALETNPGNQFRFDPEDLNVIGSSLVMTNYPSNPTGQVASREYWKALCAYCELYGLRLFNDAAYAALPHTNEHCTLAAVAVDYPNLSWIEAYSGSKIGNFTGWRVGAMVGSADFIADVANVKGNSDSGFNAALAGGILHVLEHDRESLDATRRLYTGRTELLTNVLQEYGLELAVQPQAGFFTLWQCPKRAFGQVIENSEEFNRLMIMKTGIVGVHFNPYMRYAVCGDVEAMIGPITEGFKEANVSYK